MINDDDDHDDDDDDDDDDDSLQTDRGRFSDFVGSESGEGDVFTGSLTCFFFCWWAKTRCGDWIHVRVSNIRITTLQLPVKFMSIGKACCRKQKDIKG